MRYRLNIILLVEHIHGRTWEGGFKPHPKFFRVPIKYYNKIRTHFF